MLSLAERRQQVLYDKKWKIFLSRSWLFRFIPFADLALAAGSMAMGNVRSESDFDVIIGVRVGRIFTARFFSVLAFEMFGWRRRKEHFSGVSAKDKICLNHFVAPAAFRLSPPHNAYWQELYRNLVPLYGEPAKVREFFLVNQTWAGEVNFKNDDTRYRHRTKSFFKRKLEWFLSGKTGDWLEKTLRRWQIAKIEASAKSGQGFEPRIIYNDNELEFHPDTKRILDYLARKS